MCEKNRYMCLDRARKEEETGRERISPEERPAFHLTPPTGWMNDPNGFSFYGGLYHLFFQYNPYAPCWSTMHWGHAVSADCIRWEYRPAVLAPDRTYDAGGCFSGCAVTLADGRHLLMYTGLTRAEEASVGEKAENKRDERKGEPCWLQVQNAAVGDGTEYEKVSCNPVIGTDAVPEDCSRFDFRDPRIITLRDGTFLALVSARCEDGLGEILLYRSRDGFAWEYWKVLCKNTGRFGTMWECPDFFELGDKWFLLLSPMEMLPEDPEYRNGHGTIVLAGAWEEDQGIFTPDYDQAVDYGIDFYAAQTLLTPDGRRVMIAWMQNWATLDMKLEGARWAGQMTIPRELSWRCGRLYQQPVRELSQYYGNTVFYKKVPVSDERSLYGVEGRIIDLEVEVSPAPGESLFQSFSIWLASDAEHHTEVRFRPADTEVRIDRSFSGCRKAVIHSRACRVPESRDGYISLRIILDRCSAEIFINQGRYVMTALLYTDLSAEQISFRAVGKAMIDVSKREIRI